MKQVVFVFLFLVFHLSSAQSRGVLSGKILDSEMYNEPLLMASVSLKDTPWRTQTNFNGNFEITKVVPGNYILQISFLGYETLELPVTVNQNRSTFINHSLKAKKIKMMDITEVNVLSKEEASFTYGLK